MGLPDTLDEFEKLMGELENLLTVSLDYPRSEDEIFLVENSKAEDTP